jgi:hypothetical protein
MSGCTPADSGPTAQGAARGTPTPSTAEPSVAPKNNSSADTGDYQRLLLTAADLSDSEDTFTQQSQAAQTDHTRGASAFFVNQKDTRAISDTVSIYPDAAAAAASLNQATATFSTKVAGGTPKPIAVGTSGVTISGTAPDGDKAVTLMSFTEGRALVRLEFQSATGDPTTDRFVTDVGKMQQIALRIGLSDAE